MMAEGVDAEAEMDGLFAGDDMYQEQAETTQTLTQEEAAEAAQGGGANLDVTGAPGEQVKKRIIRNPQPKLNADRLMGPRGLHTLEHEFKDWKSLGKGREFEDLDIVMKKMEHWAHRLFPKLPFDGVLQVLANREGKKKTVATHVKKIRLGMVNEMPKSAETVEEEEEEVEREVERYGEGGEADQPDVFNELLRAAGMEGASAPPAVQVTNRIPVSDEQKERMKRNRELAEQKRKERQERLRREKEMEEEEMEREMLAAEAASEWSQSIDKSQEKSNNEKQSRKNTSEDEEEIEKELLESASDKSNFDKGESSSRIEDSNDSSPVQLGEKEKRSKEKESEFSELNLKGADNENSRETSDEAVSSESTCDEQNEESEKSSTVLKVADGDLMDIDEMMEAMED